MNEVKFKCPYCLHEFTKSEARHQKNEKGETVFYCPNPQLDSATMRPKCTKRLPLRFFQGKSAVISIVGGAGVGKTYFVMALNRILKEDSLLSRLGISGVPRYPDEESRVYFEKMMKDIEDGNTLEATRTNEGVEDRALCFQVNIHKSKRENNKRFMSAVTDGNGKFSLNRFYKEIIRRIRQINLFGNGYKTIYFSFFDNPGEAFNDEFHIFDKMNVCNSDAVFFLIAPEQISGFINLISGEGSSDKVSPLYTVVNNLTDAYHHDKEEVIPKDFWQRIQIVTSKLFSKKKISVPFACCFSKFDLVRRGFGTEVTFPNDIKTDDYKSLGIIKGHDVDKVRLKDVIVKNHKTIHDKLQDEFEATNSIDLLDASFSNYRLFAIQSVEVTKDGTETNVAWSPHGLSLPMIWLLKQLKLL